VKYDHPGEPLLPFSALNDRGANRANR
jgi:hypothetical protein